MTLNNILQPGPKLDTLVTLITDIEGKPSTDSAAAMQAWEWLENNKPREWERIALIRDDDRIPAVVEIGDNCALETPGYYVVSLVIGQTYPHAICLAVVEAARLIGRIK